MPTTGKFSKLWRISPTLAVAAALMLLLGGIILSTWFEHNYERTRSAQLTAQARILADTVTAALSFGDKKAALEYVDALAANPEIEAAGIYDLKGALFAAYTRRSSETLPSKAGLLGFHLAGGNLSVTVPVIQGTTMLGRVYLRIQADPLTRRVARFGLVILLVAMAGLVLIVFAAMQSALTKANAELHRHADQLATANANLEAEIGERERTEEALRQAQKMEVIGQLTGGVAHDFNNLLQVIIGNLDAMRRADPSDRVGRLVEAAMRGADRAAILTQRLLAFARRQPLEPKPIDVNKLVAGMSDLLRRTLGEGINIETILAGGLWRVSADANQLENAILNLAVNARDAMAGGGKLTIETANTYLDAGYAALHEEVREGQHILIAVTDTGAGMPPAVLAKAFDPFFTTKEVGKGSGLGLSQVYGFTKQSGGHVKIYSEVGVGTTIKIYLPRLVGAEEQAETGESAAASPAGLQEERILVVEDDEDVRLSTVTILRDLGYSVIEASDGPAALRVLEQQPQIVLLFTDVGLPGGLDGRQLANEALRRRPGLKVLFTTGYARNAIVHNGRLDHGVEFIGKPFTSAGLAAKIRHILDGSSPR